MLLYLCVGKWNLELFFVACDWDLEIFGFVFGKNMFAASGVVSGC